MRLVLDRGILQQREPKAQFLPAVIIGTFFIGLGRSTTYWGPYEVTPIRAWGPSRDCQRVRKYW